MILQAQGNFIPEAGRLEIRIDLQGSSEIEHEILAAFFDGSNEVEMHEEHRGDELFAVFVIQDEKAFDRARHALENRKRVRDGKPTLEQESEQQKQAEEASKRAQEEALAAEEKAREEKAKSDDDFARRIADAIHSRLTGSMPAEHTHAAADGADMGRAQLGAAEEKHEEPKPTAPEPDKVQ